MKKLERAYEKVFYLGDYVVLNPLQGWILGLIGFFEGRNRRKFPESVIFKNMDVKVKVDGDEAVFEGITFDTEIK